MVATGLAVGRPIAHSMHKTMVYNLASVVSLVVLISTLTEVANASECSSCAYLAKDCSNSSNSVDVCDITGNIQIDDVFCNDNECECAVDRECVSTVVGCANIFQARNRRRCLGNVTLSRRFKQCAIDQGLTTLSTSNVASDWIYFKQGIKCQSTDCLAVKMFHQSGLVQCGHLLAVWKTNSPVYDPSKSVTLSKSDGDTVYHFVADGSRASDTKAGTFLYSVPWSSEAVALMTKQTNSTAIKPCYVIQTRNQPNSTCEGVYLQFDASVQFAKSDDYVMSKLSWPIWFVVVGSVVAATIAIVTVGVVAYRFQHTDMSPSVENNEDGGLLWEPDDLRDRKSSSPVTTSPACPGPASPPSGKNLSSTDLRQRAAPDVTQMEAGTSRTAL